MSNAQSVDLNLTPQLSASPPLSVPAIEADKQPLVSVIIPSYNRVSFLKQTIESVLAQSYSQVELLVIDDGSSDGSYELAQQYEQIRLLTHPERQNRGQSASINLGLQQAQGDYIAILDSDDYWHSDKLMTQVGYLQQHADVGLVYVNGWSVDANSQQLYRIYDDHHVEQSSPAHSVADEVLMNCYFLVPNNALVRASVFRQVGGFDESLRAAQDHDMAIRIAEVTRLAYINKELFYYRRHANSISQKQADLRWQNGFLILDKARRRYQYPSATIRKRRAVLHFRTAQCQVEKGQWLRAAKNAVTAAILDPVRSFKVLARLEPIRSPH